MINIHRRISCIVIAFMLITLLLLSALNGPFQASRQEDNKELCGCRRLNDRLPTVYIEERNATAKASKTVKLTLSNNTNCAIMIMTDGTQVINGRPEKLDRWDLNDSLIIRPLYKANSKANKLAFVYYGLVDDVVSSKRLSGGQSVNFLVARVQVARRRKIALPFYYEWEGNLYNARTSVEHLVYFP